MVKLPGFSAFVFESGLDRLRDAFRASIGIMSEAQRQAEQAQHDYLARGEDDDEYDEDGVLVRSTRVELDWAALQASLAAHTVREAFVTSTFHYWECTARNVTGDHDVTFVKLAALMRQHGHPMHPDLTLLNHLNNLLKHNNPSTGQKVFEVRPDLFLFGRKPTGDWRYALTLTDQDVEHFFAVVRASGPQSHAHTP
jgi:hypothetical protein